MQSKPMPQWRYCETLESCSPLAASPQSEGVALSSQVIGESLSNMVFWFTGFSSRLYWDKNETDVAGFNFLSIIESDASFISGFRREIHSACDKLMGFRENLAGLQSKSNEQLADLLEEYEKLHFGVIKLGILPNTLDYASGTGYNILAEKLEDYLLTLCSDRSKVANAASVLVTPAEDTWPVREHKAFLRVAGEILENGVEPGSKEELRLLALHSERFGWITFLHVGPIKWTVAHYADELAKMRKDGRNPRQELEQLEQKGALLPSNKASLIKELGIDGKHATLFATLAELVYLKAYRKDCTSMGWLCLDAIAREAAKRLGVSALEAHFLSLKELTAAVRTDSVDQSLLRERSAECAFVMLDGMGRVISGKELHDFTPSLEAAQKTETAGGVNELSGNCACPGYAKGTVRIIQTAQDMAKMRKGDILVSHMTQPEIVVAMKKAAAIVTDMGGLTCHAAIVSRELGIPCVIGTRIATKAFKDGDIVEVDAAKGIVRRLQT